MEFFTKTCGAIPSIREAELICPQCEDETLLIKESYENNEGGISIKERYGETYFLVHTHRARTPKYIPTRVHYYFCPNPNCDYEYVEVDELFIMEYSYY